MLFPTPSNDVISVSALNRLARDLLESGLAPTWIGGEISNLTLASSGHAYFSLKDASAQVRCVMFRQRLALLPFRLNNGMQIELKGAVTIYEARGDFQINVNTMRAAGRGQLFEAFERLKAALSAEGLFEPERKRPIPFFPETIGIVTSGAAAALRDVVTTLSRRMPSIKLILYPTPVQGDGAAEQIAKAIYTANERAEAEVLIVCRGGGSIEDLWSFNEEVVARAIAASTIPVISGVGHETDFTICDFVADLRAPTPTAAAEMASPSQQQQQARLEHETQRLARSLSRRLSDKSQRLDQLAHRLRHPGERLAQQQQLLERHQTRLQQLVLIRLEQARWRLQLATTRTERHHPQLRQSTIQLEQLSLALSRGINRTLKNRQSMVERLRDALESINPEAVLQRGYAIVQNHKGEAVKSTQSLKQGERVTIRLAEGSTGAVIDHESKELQPTLPF